MSGSEPFEREPLMIKLSILPAGETHLSAPRVSRAAAMLSLLGTCFNVCAGDDLRFSRSFFSGRVAGEHPYLEETALQPGLKKVDVIVNGQLLKQASVLFSARPPATSIEPCIDGPLLHALPLAQKILEGIQSDAGCIELSRLVPGSSAHYDSSELQLLITLPQAAQRRQQGDYIEPSQRDNGIAAAFVDYKARHRSGRGMDTSSLSLWSGFNLGAWRLRNRTWITHRQGNMQAESSGTTIERDLPYSGLRLLLGQGATSGSLFESLPFTGVRVHTDDRMLPDALRGYAPAIHGIAHQVSTVRIRQNGRLIREMPVPPGPFVVDDLPGGSFSGELDVTVTGDDGGETRFRVSAAASPLALRPGAHQLSLTAGRIDVSRQAVGDPQSFVEATYAHGLGNRLTLLGGGHYRPHYQAVLMGGALSTPVGAVGGDVMSQRALQRGESRSGRRFRLSYEYVVQPTGSRVGMTLHRYGSSGRLDSIGCRASRGHCYLDNGIGASMPSRQRLQWNLSQRLGVNVAMYLNGGLESFWKGQPGRSDVQLGFQGNLRSATWSVTALRYHDEKPRSGTEYSLLLMLPVGRQLRSAQATVQLSPGKPGPVRVGISGALLEDGVVNYAASASSGNAPAAYQAQLAYQGSQVRLVGSVDRAQRGRSWDLAAEGSGVLHGGGLTLGRSIGDAAVLVEAPGAQGAEVRNVRGVRVGRNGYALVPYATPYRWNRIELDPGALPLDVELRQTSQRVAPSSGSISRLRFEAVRQRTLFIDAADTAGNRLPFGAPVYDAAGRSLGTVAQGGVIRLGSPADVGAVFVQPPDSAPCRLDYQRPSSADAYGLFWSQSVCMPVSIPSTGAP